MRIEVNNVYQKRSISKFKISITIIVFLTFICMLVWRLCYERFQVTDVMAFADWNVTDKNTSEIIQKAVNKKRYIPVVNENSFEKIEKIYNLADDGKKRVYLTFDDGPSKAVTPYILDILKEENVTATFFVLGNMVKENPDILKRIYIEGHYIANHGVTHVYSKIYENKEMVLKEYNMCEENIREALGIQEYETHLFRFPGGLVGGPYNDIKSEAADLLKNNNVTYLNWNALTRDSEGEFSKEELFENYLATIDGKNNLVILMHDAANKKTTIEVLKDIIKDLKGKDYVFGNMREIFKK